MPLIEDMTALAWTALRKPLESFMLTSAVIGNGVLLGRDGSLVSLFHLDGSRALMGPGEMAAFVELACRRLNSDFTAPGHALHVVFERAPDEAAALVEAVSRHQHSRARECGLRLDDVDFRAQPASRAAACCGDPGDRLLDPTRRPACAPGRA